MKYTAKTNKILEKVSKGRLKKAEAARQLKVSRKTIYQWLARYQQSRSKIANKIRSTVLDKTGKGKKRTLFKKDILRISLANSNFGPKKISDELRKKDKYLSSKSVWLLLKDLDLETGKKRWSYAFNFKQPAQAKDINFPAYLKLIPEARKQMVEEVLIGNQPASHVCLKYHISRKTFYKWLKRYKEAKEKETILLKAMEDSNPQGFAHPRSISKEFQENILGLVRQYPQYSTHKIAQRISGVGNHGVQNVFKRLNLNTYEKRLTYAKTHQPVIKPLPVTAWTDRLKIVWDKFIPTIAPAGPPSSFISSFSKQPRKFAKIILLSTFLTTLFSSTFIY